MGFTKKDEIKRICGVLFRGFLSGESGEVVALLVTVEDRPPDQLDDLDDQSKLFAGLPRRSILRCPQTEAPLVGAFSRACRLGWRARRRR